MLSLNLYLLQNSTTMNLKHLFIATILIIATITSCDDDETDTTDYAGQATCTGAVPTYTADIAVILNNNCALSSCHNASSARDGINLSDYSNASSQFKNNKKNLIAVHHGSGVDAMPRNASKLSDATINKLGCWVKNGCPQ